MHTKLPRHRSLIRQGPLGSKAIILADLLVDRGIPVATTLDLLSSIAVGMEVLRCRAWRQSRAGARPRLEQRCHVAEPKLLRSSLRHEPFLDAGVPKTKRKNPTGPPHAGERNQVKRKREGLSSTGSEVTP